MAVEVARCAEVAETGRRGQSYLVAPLIEIRRCLTADRRTENERLIAGDDSTNAVIDVSIAAFDVPESTACDETRYVGLHGFAIDEGAPAYCIARSSLVVVEIRTTPPGGRRLEGRDEVVVYLLRHIITRHRLIPVGVPNFGGASTVPIDNATKRRKAVLVGSIDEKGTQSKDA